MRSLKKKQNTQKNLFDHITAIRLIKDPSYYNSLSESEKKGFNHWAILHALSMDSDLIEIVSFLWRDGYYDKIPSPQFYKVLIDLIPKSNRKLNWIKKEKTQNDELVSYIAQYYLISKREANDYLNIFMESDLGVKTLINIVQGFGLSDKEVEKLF